MCKNCEKYGQLTLEYRPDDVRAPSRTILREGVDVVPLEKWRYNEARSYPRAGGPNWTPRGRRVRITDGKIEAVAIQTHEWHGGYSDGGDYCDYRPVCGDDVVANDAFVVGRHAPDGIEDMFNIAGQQNVLFPDSGVGDVMAVLRDVAATALSAGADTLLLQNTPAVLGELLLSRDGSSIPAELGINVGLVISEAVPAGEIAERRVHIGDSDVVDAAVVAVKIANPRARVRVDGGDVIITVAPPRRFAVKRVTIFTTRGERFVFSPRD